MGTIVDPFYAHRHIDFQKELSHETLAQRGSLLTLAHRAVLVSVSDQAPPPHTLRQLLAIGRIVKVFVEAVIFTTGFVVERSICGVNRRPRSVWCYLLASRILVVIFADGLILPAACLAVVFLADTIVFALPSPGIRALTRARVPASTRTLT